MSRLRIYTVQINPSLPQPYEAAEFIEEGFSWAAFVFTGIWALYHRLWWIALGLFAFNFLMIHLLSSGTLTHAGVTIIDLGVRTLVGCYANDWRRAKLRRNGYIVADIVSGDSLLRGQQRFFDRYFSAHPTDSFVS
jgi:hypothetical protein